MVITVVGPHTPREVRKVLSATLAPLAPSRTEARKATLAPAAKVETLTVPSDHAQPSYFFSIGDSDLKVFRVAEVLAETKLGPGNVSMEKEGPDLIRLDVSANASEENIFNELTPEESRALFLGLQRDWLDRYESQQTRAEMLALAELYGKQPEIMVEESEFPALVAEAKQLLKTGLQSKAKGRRRPYAPGIGSCQALNRSE